MKFLLRPTRDGTAAVIVIFSLILTIALHDGLFGIPAIFIVTSQFFKYAYILFDHTTWVTTNRRRSTFIKLNLVG